MISLKSSCACVLCLVAALAFSVGSIGCRQDKPPESMAIGQLPGELQKVFKEARPEVKETVDRICAALQAADHPGAYEQVGRLCSLPDETPEQRRAAASALLTVTKVLQSAQAQGDQRAAQVLRSHQRNR